EAMSSARTSTGAMQADAPPPESGRAGSAAPAPSPAVMPGGEAPGACLLPGWENYFEELSSSEGGAGDDEAPTAVPSVEAGISTSPSADGTFDAGTDNDSDGG